MTRSDERSAAGNGGKYKELVLCIPTFVLVLTSIVLIRGFRLINPQLGLFDALPQNIQVQFDSFIRLYVTIGHKQLHL